MKTDFFLASKTTTTVNDRLFYFGSCSVSQLVWIKLCSDVNSFNIFIYLRDFTLRHSSIILFNSAIEYIILPYVTAKFIRTEL